MKQLSFIICSAFLAACASPEARPTVAGPARYATPDEAARLHVQAAANFQRERERQGMQVVTSDDRARQRRVTAQPVSMQASAPPPVLEGPKTIYETVYEAPAPRRKVSPAEARYAMQIGKSPFDLTPGERAVAAGY